MLCYTGLTHHFYVWHSGTQSTQISKIKNGGLDQYGAEPFEQQQLATSGVEGVKLDVILLCVHAETWGLQMLML